MKTRCFENLRSPSAADVLVGGIAPTSATAPHPPRFHHDTLSPQTQTNQTQYPPGNLQSPFFTATSPRQISKRTKPIEAIFYKNSVTILPMSTAAIALGANLGDRRQNIEAALRALGALPGVDLVKTSALLENPSVGGPPGAPDFLNAAALVETILTPDQLLDCLLDIERQLGRSRARHEQKNEPRPIDLDLLFYDDHLVQTDRLTLPHPRMHQRRFVLQPLAQIAPDAVHPVLKKTIRHLLLQLTHECTAHDQ
jgi:2-amino-4-hydroxy-6-hydroxymethyldihydropteridine diphosphokinase